MLVRPGSVAVDLPKRATRLTNLYPPDQGKVTGPTIVFESGFSESLSHLRFDAGWWLKQSGGEVKIVIIISIVRAESMLLIEQWGLTPLTGRGLTLRAASTYLNNNNNSPPQIPTKIQEIAIDPNTVTGAPLVLEFEKIFLRPAVPPEGDIRFTGQELAAWAAALWQGLR
jgi:hypothetical protein